jgi:hypothetical protein
MSMKSDFIDNICKLFNSNFEIYIFFFKIIYKFFSNNSTLFLKKVFVIEFLNLNQILMLEIIGFQLDLILLCEPLFLLRKTSKYQ